MSNYLIDLLENYTSFKIPRINDFSSLHSNQTINPVPCFAEDHTEGLEIKDHKLIEAESSWLYLTGLFFIGVIGIISLVFAADYVAPSYGKL